jgi:hypothetical protein
MFIPWMAITAGWVVHHTKETKDHWLARIFWVEGIFLFFFTGWYLSRYYSLIPGLELWVVVGIIVLLSKGIIIGGWLYDRKHPGDSLTKNGQSL